MNTEICPVNSIFKNRKNVLQKYGHTINMLFQIMIVRINAQEIYVLSLLLTIIFSFLFFVPGYIFHCLIELIRLVSLEEETGELILYPIV
jgi:hypothetical protein